MVLQWFFVCVTDWAFNIAVMVNTASRLLKFQNIFSLQTIEQIVQLLILWECLWLILYQFCFLCADRKFKISATMRHSSTVPTSFVNFLYCNLLLRNVTEPTMNVNLLVLYKFLRACRTLNAFRFTEISYIFFSDNIWQCKTNVGYQN